MAVTWTDLGFKQMFAGDVLDFTITNLPTSADYYIVIRYEGQVCKINSELKRLMDCIPN
jgi:hypothetical protein